VNAELSALHDMVIRSVRALMPHMTEQEETLVRRMLNRWPVETETPVLVVDHDGNLVGLGPDTPIGSAQSVFVYAKDCAA
jgi:hypothetical protein